MSDSRVRQNYHEECELEINNQINRELYASYMYLSMSYYFDRDDVALSGLREHFKDQSLEELGHAEKLMKYQNKRGGRIVLQNIEKPEKDDWESSMGALTAALAFEKSINQHLLDLRKLAETHNDFEMCDFLDSEFLHQQVGEIRKLDDLIVNLERTGEGLGEYLFDKHEMNGERDEETEVQDELAQ
ncbi:soma ferritin [Nephila pilipes]|uniref:Ferritin n=1 Tax=Nephila pilipes TaxID=299642 RepID=A0A8X6MR77_NEPPI|nr:soma ferritin [Nephila pilipes]